MNGVSKYDGYTFKKFYSTSGSGSISGNWAFAICEDAGHNIWIGTLDGVNMFDARTETFTAYKNNFSNKITSCNLTGRVYCGSAHRTAWCD